jgi:hypothetical protein
MPITLSQMAAHEAKLTVTGGHLGDNSINLVYFPNKITLKMQMALSNGAQGTNELLVEVIKSWDVLDGEDMYAITSENLAALGMAVLEQLGYAIINDLRPN